MSLVNGKITTGSKDAVASYIRETIVKLHPVQEKLMKVTLEHPWGMMMGSIEQMQFLSQLVKNMGGKKAIEIGVFTGTSSLAIALMLPSDGRLVACDIKDEYVSIGRPFWKEAGVDKIIDVKIAPAAESLQSLIDNGEAGTFDFAFIDADKQGYKTYYELSLQLLRPGGLIALDNMLWGGTVADPTKKDESTRTLRELNSFIAADKRVMYTLLPIGDGTGLAFKL